MYKGAALYLVIISFAIANGEIFDFNKLHNYTRIFGFTSSENNNELWQGIIRDCSKKVTFSCIQKNAYTYLDRAFIDRDNITVFDGFSLTRNNLDYDSCVKNDLKDNLVEDTNGSDESRRIKNDFDEDKVGEDKIDEEVREEEEYLTPLEEITHALRKKTFKFLATRDYKIQLSRYFGEGANFKISPREIDENGALIRIDFDNREVEEQQHGRLFFKKIKKQIQSKILMTLLVLVLLIKLVKFKLLVVIPFLFGIGTAKKLFLKMLLFFVPAFAHVFKLCSSYYSSHATKFHHHHHKIIHHHEHIPVPVPVPQYNKPVYYDHPPPSHSSPIILDEDFNGYDYAHPHIQYRKDIEELKEWGIEPYDESYDQVAPQSGVIHPASSTPGGPKMGPKFPGPFGMPPQYAANSKPMHIPGFPDSLPPHAQSLAYAGYGPPLPPPPPGSRPPPPLGPALPIGVSGFGPSKSLSAQPIKQQSFGPPVGFLPQPQPQPQHQHRVSHNQQRNDVQQQASSPAAAVSVAVPSTHKPYDDEFYGPIVERLDKIFGQLRFLEESCRERLVCSMYKNPALYSPHSNLVSNELSRDPQELQQGNSASASSQRFHQYLTAARIGQDGGDCLRAFHCNINTEQ